MNDNIDLVKILKYCPKGWSFYSSVYGDVKFEAIKLQRLKCRYDPDMPEYAQPIFEEEQCPIKFTSHGVEYCVSSAGEHIKGKGECTFFPSKEQRDWRKFTAPWYKKDMFDPKTLKPFDKVLVRDRTKDIWNIGIFSHIDDDSVLSYVTTVSSYIYCIPYNDDTKQLLRTKDEAPEYYRYWED